MSGISPKLPFHRDDVDGYALTKTYHEAIRQNLKHLVLTAPGERIMDPHFGCGLLKYLFESNSVDTHSAIAAKITEQVQKYMSHVEINDIEIKNATHVWMLSGTYEELPPNELNNISENRLSVRMMYTVPALSQTAVLSIGL
jgi:phage baseplate assembly protein W